MDIQNKTIKTEGNMLKTKAEIKENFETGDKPTEAQFHEWIDAMYSRKGANYVVAEPGDNVLEKYDEAKTLSPTSSNRVNLIIMPGTYSLSEEWDVDEDYVDIIGLGSIKKHRGCIPKVILENETINVTADHVRVKGISVGTQDFKTGEDKPNQTFEDCLGEYYSFGGNGTASGTFINCEGGSGSFGGSWGTFTGKCYYCRVAMTDFETPTSSGEIFFSIDSSGAVDYMDAE